MSLLAYLALNSLNVMIVPFVVKICCIIVAKISFKASLKMQIDELKKDIILKKGVRYFDFTASALGLKSVEKAVKKVLLSYANTHSDSSLNSFATQKHYENARQSIKKSLGLSDEFALIACGSGSSAAIKKFQELLGIYAPPKVRAKFLAQISQSSDLHSKKDLPLVVISPYEHHSNELSFREGLCECVRVPLSASGEIDFDFLQSLLERERKANKTRQIIASFTLASNVTGILSDYKRLSSLFRKHNVLVAFDASSFIPYKNIECKRYDALFISPHKLLGGVGSCGLLAIRKNLLSDKPSFAAGGTVGYVSRTSVDYLCDYERLEEAGTPPILQLIRAALAFEIKDSIGVGIIEKQEECLKEYFFKKADEFERENSGQMILYAKNVKNRLPIFALNIKGISPFDLAYHLSKSYKIETRAGCACAGPYGHDLLGLQDNANFKQKPGWLRVSFHYTQDFGDIDYFFVALKKCVAKLKN